MTRLGAKLIDSAVWGVPLIFFIVAAGAESGALATIAALGPLAIPIVQVVLLVKDGQTLRKKALNIRLVMFETGENGGFVPNVLLRAWLNALASIIPFYSVVDILFIFRDDHRCIHDLIAGTKVIKLSGPHRSLLRGRAFGNETPRLEKTALRDVPRALSV